MQFQLTPELSLQIPDLASWPPRTGAGPDFQEKWFSLDEIKLFQFTPELSLQIPALASWAPRTIPGLDLWLSLNGIGTCQLTPELSLRILALANWAHLHGMLWLCVWVSLYLNLIGFLSTVAYLYENLLSHLHSWQSYLRLRNAFNFKSSLFPFHAKTRSDNPSRLKKFKFLI